MFDMIRIYKLSHKVLILFSLNFLDKTLSLLKAGAEALSKKLNKSIQMDPIDLSLPQPLSSCKLKSSLKQMLLTNNLQLIPNDKIINVSFIQLSIFDSFFLYMYGFL